jgi:hypothetical protein
LSVQCCQKIREEPPVIVYNKKGSMYHDNCKRDPRSNK